MKKLSRILAALVVFTMLCGMVTITHAAQFSDVSSENKYYYSTTILSAFGIINGYEDGTFGPDKDVTRAEFATMLMRAMASAGIGSTDAAGTPFTDISGHWGISDIRTAYDLGIINGMTPTTFEPNSNVTYEQAFKMVVCALNYGGQSEAIYNSMVATNPSIPWYYGYMQTARTLGLTDDISIVNGQPAKRAHIAQMIYNALDVNMLEKIEVAGGEPMYMESQQNWLKDKLKVTRVQGELLADESNTISSDGATARPGYALLTDNSTNTKNSIKKNGISLDGLLGKSVEYYYKTDIDGIKSLVLIYSKSGSNTSLKIDASNIDRITGNYADGYNVSYYESATDIKAKTLKVSPKPIISFNGEVRTDVSVSELNIEAGTLEFISNGGDYNKINVEA
ncbi:MAG: S-layer homology domain-containing protein, partial [Clostridia bacterium]|nr:S-layer homology domain-containing protein [Clostridia bacterium]